MKLPIQVIRAAAIFASALSITAHALPADTGEDGTTPATDHALDCLADTTGSISVTPTTIALGASATVNWSVKVPANCAIIANNLRVNGMAVALKGSMSVQPMANTSYSLRVAAAGLSKTFATAALKVTLPPVVRIKGNTSEWKRLLVQALGEPNKLVLLAEGLDMDLTGYSGIAIAEGVTLTSEAPAVVGNAPALYAAAPNSGFSAGFAPGGVGLQGPVARNAHKSGPRLYTTSRPKPLFIIRCFIPGMYDHSVRVNINGFRLHGPHFETMEGDDNLERGIMIDSCIGVEISNMELAGWSGQAIYVQDPLDRMFNPDAVKIHDNFIHHNQHQGGNGYGVDVSAGAYALIERNVFDLNRHAIAASGKPGTGYRARHNLVLKGGGVHGKWYNEYTHQFDVHGDANCPDIPLNQHTWNCGNAGDQFWYESNAFQYTKDNAIKLRGAPRVAAYIDNNVFAHGSVGDAVQLNDPVRVHLGTGASANRAGVDPYGKYGVCDFDADGKDDLFLATGASWWYSSGGKMHWVYLNSHTELLHEVGLGDFNGDGRCDVFAVNRYAKQWEISSGGNSAWTALAGSYDIPIEQLRFGDFNGDRIQDVFHRAPDGQWYAISPGVYGWTALQSSSFALDQLRFGDFNNDRVTDVIAVQGGRWSVSWGARTGWAPLNSKLSDAVKPLLIGDINADGYDDIARYAASADGLTGTWYVSWSGSGDWTQLATLAWVDNEAGREIRPAHHVRSFMGRFNIRAGADVLALETERMGYLYGNGNTGFAPHSLYAY